MDWWFSTRVLHFSCNFSVQKQLWENKEFIYPTSFLGRWVKVLFDDKKRYPGVIIPELYGDSHCTLNAPSLCTLQSMSDSGVH